MDSFLLMTASNSPRVLLSPAVEDPREFAKPFFICDKTQDISVFVCDYSVRNSTPA